MTCVECGKENVEELEQECEFQLGTRHPVSLKAKGPVFVCKDCGHMLADWRMERAKTLAVSEYFHSVEDTPRVPEPYQSAHCFSSNHKEQLKHAGMCACFYCLSFFSYTEIEDWIDGGETALCPRWGLTLSSP